MKPIRTPDSVVLARAKRVRRKLKANPFLTIRKVAAQLGLSYWATWRYARGDCKVLYRLGR